MTDSSSTPTRKWRVTRRGFLIGLGATGVGLALGVTLGKAPLRLFIAEQLDAAGGPPGGPAGGPFAWFEITPDNEITLFVSKVEMGQGVHTALAQIAAEELEIEMAQLTVIQGSTHRGPEDAMGTGGSTSVSSSYVPLRQAAATLREMLRQRAAELLSLPVAELVARAGGVESATGDRRLTYGELVASQTAWEVPEEEAPLKPTAAFRLVGQSVPRVDLPAKITGSAIYGYDLRQPDMLYGAAVHPPTIAATMRAAQPGRAANLSGVVQVVVDDGFAGVVAATRAQAWAGAAAIEVDWDQGKLWQQGELESLVTVGTRGGITIQKEGSATRYLRDRVDVAADYRTPIAIHAQMEPQAALADVTADSARVWASTQAQVTVQRELARVLKMDAEQIEVIPTYLGGGFGRKLNIEAAVEAARLSQAVGRPVHVGWTRNEEMRYGYFRPPTHSRLSARLDGGRITALEHKQASGDVAFPFFPAIAATALGADFGAWRGGRIQYAGIPHRHTAAWRIKLPVRTGWWRGLGLLANTFAVESFMDELAHTANRDPLQFRLDHLGDDPLGQRIRATLQLAADKAGWETPLPPGRARGIAWSLDVDTVAAQVAEISLDRASGKIRVERIVAALDPGFVINPDGATAQVQGSIIMGLGSTLIEEMTVQDGVVTPSNFDLYPLLTIADTPKIDVHLRDSDGIPRGVGEPPLGPVAAAVGNAFYALTGVRLRRLPFTPARVLAAL